MKRIIIALLPLLLLFGCNQEWVEEKSEHQIENEKFFDALEENSEYTKLTWLNTDRFVYYKVLEESTGESDEKPYQNSKVRVELGGWLITGEEFQPVETMDLTIFDLDPAGRPSGSITGLGYALQDMKIGERREVIVPHQLGYGQFRHSTIPPYSTLIFDVKLLKIITP